MHETVAAAALDLNDALNELPFEQELSTGAAELLEQFKRVRQIINGLHPHIL